MPVKDTFPKNLRPYRSLGVHFARITDEEGEAEECPFCGKDGGKFGVNLETSKYNCFVCGAKGNSLEFLREVAEQSSATEDQLAELAADRGILNPETLERWGLRVSPITGEWLWPMCTPDGRVTSLGRYEHDQAAGKRIVKAVQETEVGMFGIPLWDQSKGTVFVTETWNAPILWEVLKTAKRIGTPEAPSYEFTGAESESLLAETNVIGVPGANVWKPGWCKLLAGKRVVLVPDNDHPRVNRKTKAAEDGAGIEGAKRTAKALAEAVDPPDSIYFLRWGPDGSGYSGSLPTGYDVRDSMTSVGDDPVARVGALATLLGMIEPIPADWVPGRGAGAKHGSPRLETIRCESWHELIRAWRPAMFWSEDLEHMLSVCLAAVVSTGTKGEQIWVMVMAPPSSGKTTIVDAVGMAHEHVWMKSVLNKIHSGYKEDKTGEKDFGDVPLLRDRTVIVKDGDPLLEDPNRGLILAQYRDIYDGSASVKYGHGVMFSHEGVRFTLIVCGTAKMRVLDSVEAGARFVNCSFNETADPHRERLINRHVAYRAIRDVKSEANGSVATQYDPDMVLAKRVTGGYVQFLRRAGQRLIDAVEADERTVERIIVFGEFCSYLRARPPKYQDEVTEREMSHRLVSQFVRLAFCLAAVKGKREVDAAILEQVRRIALDTARGKTLHVASVLYDSGRGGRNLASLESDTGESGDKLQNLLKFLVQINVAERVPPPEASALGLPGKRWRLTPLVERLYREVCDA